MVGATLTRSEANLMIVYFAGNSIDTDIPLRRVGIHYRIASFYDIDRGQQDLDVLHDYRHVIVDSGLFALMFGAGAGEVTDEAGARRWMLRYVDYIRSCSLRRPTFVEVDSQCLIGSDATWELRREFRSLVGPDVDVMNVYHLPDENPDDLIDYADYIGVGMPELSRSLSRAERHRVVAYIARKASAKGKRVHLLGTAEVRYLRDFSFCTSCDTSIWLNVARFGQLRIPEFGTVKYPGAIKGERRWECLCASARMVRSLAQKYAGDQR